MTRVLEGGIDGLDRDLFSRINVGYTNTLDNGLVITGSISYRVNQRGTGGTATADVDPDAVMEMMGQDMMVEADVTGGSRTRPTTLRTSCPSASAAASEP